MYINRFDNITPKVFGCPETILMGKKLMLPNIVGHIRTLRKLDYPYTTSTEVF